MKEMYIVDGGFPGAMSELDDPFVNLRCMQSVICKKNTECYIRSVFLKCSFATFPSWSLPYFMTN